MLIDTLNSLSMLVSNICVWQEADGNKVIKEVIHAPGQKKYRFCKVKKKMKHGNWRIPLFISGI